MVAGAHDSLARLVGWCGELSTNVRGAALTIHVSLGVDADQEDKPLSCLDLCAQRGVCQAADCWPVQKRLACPSNRSKDRDEPESLHVSNGQPFVYRELGDP